MKLANFGANIALLAISGAIISYSVGFSRGRKKSMKTIDYIDGYENGCRSMDRYWRDRLRRMGFSNKI